MIRTHSFEEVVSSIVLLKGKKICRETLYVHKVLITSRFNDKILDDHFLVPVENKTSYVPL